MGKLRIAEDVEDYVPRIFFKGRAQLQVSSNLEEESARAHGWTEQPPKGFAYKPRLATDDERLAGRQLQPEQNGVHPGQS